LSSLQAGLFETAFKTVLAAQFTGRPGIDILDTSSIIIDEMLDENANGLNIAYTIKASNQSAASALIKDTEVQNKKYRVAGGGWDPSPILTLVTKIQTSYEELGGIPALLSDLSIREINGKPYHELIEKPQSMKQKDDDPLIRFSAGTQTSVSAFAIGSVFLLATALAL
jgi:hypothetical protein